MTYKRKIEALQQFYTVTNRQRIYRMANEKMNDWIRGRTQAPPANEQPQTPRTPPANAGAGAGQTGIGKKPSLNTWMRSYAKGSKY